MAGGFLLLAAGLVCAIPVVPGPGIAMIVVALLILSDHLAWARKALEWLRRRSRAAGLPDWVMPGGKNSTHKPGPPSG